MLFIFNLRKQGEVGVTVQERFEYDSQNRLVKHYHQVDNNPEELLAENTYNDLSQLVNKKVGSTSGSAPLQSIDYDYNIRGWMTEINKNQMAAADLGGKLFSYKIKYTSREGIENPDTAQFSGKNVVPKYNGNIAEVDWRAVESIGANPSTTPKRYGYAYDKINRLTAGFYQNQQNPYSKENMESLVYDLNGNISSLYRTSVMENGSSTATVIDNLTYDYTGNRATKIKDISGNSTGYKDHLGNTRVSFGKNSAGILEIVDANNYYPFGMNHLKTGNAYFGGGSYKNYKYQGQELQETGFYSFKWRNYMPDVGRFFNIDPLSEKYSYQSHYNFSENRVVDARELEGLEAVDFRKNDKYQNLVIVVQGWSGDTRKGYT